MDFYLAALLQGLCFSGLALGIYLSMTIFNIPDITTDGSYTFGAVTAGVLLSQQIPLYLIIILVLFAGALAGTATALIHTRLKINPLLAGILVMTALYSVNLKILGRSNLPLLNAKTLFDTVSLSANSNVNTLYVLAGMVLLLLLLMSYVLRTDFGIAMRATGNSENMVRALGVNTQYMKIIGLAMANALTALSGCLMVQLQGFADINMGIGIVITGLGSVIIGESLAAVLAIRSIPINLLIVLAGAVIFQFVLAFTLSIGIDATLLKLVTAVFVLLIVSLPRLSFKQSDD
ncbi:ABC transporter permease [Pedobacter sp. BS3]|uniref:ABC transporter permease n=1 Tax=Pedobacter sp. BS3 TaxID=2567937 RepID=UPI0011F0264C|nr:ABC transporter permease [Pedobacter sp. BS3]TZF84684.1 ABC transporter permease [Pedobacter sp. BS3]